MPEVLNTASAMPQFLCTETLPGVPALPVSRWTPVDAVDLRTAARMFAIRHCLRVVNRHDIRVTPAGLQDYTPVRFTQFTVYLRHSPL